MALANRRASLCDTIKSSHFVSRLPAAPSFMRTSFLIIGLMLASLGSLSACGTKTALTLPKTQPASQPAAPAKAPDDSNKPATGTAP